MIKVTVVDNVMKKPAMINNVDIADVVNNIKYDEKLKTKTENFRLTKHKVEELIKNMSDEKEIELLVKMVKKKKVETFNAIVPGCLFKDNSSRQSSNIDYVTSLYSLDFDHITNLEDVREKINNDEYTLLSYVSPSGNGLKIVVKYNKTYLTDTKEQIKYVKLQLFLFLQDYYKTKYGIEADTQATDITRNAFICFDENVYFNESSKIFDLQPNKDVVKYKTDHVKNGTDILDKIHSCLIGQKMTLREFTENVYPNTQDINYYRWIDFGWFLCSLYPHKEEQVKNYFHMFSSLDNDYNKEECEKKIENLLSSYQPNRKNYKLYFHNMMLWAERNIGLVLSVDQKKELKQEPNYIIDYINENIVIRQEEITEENYITFTHNDKSISCKYENQKIDDNVLRTIFVILNLYFPIHSPASVQNYLYTGNIKTFNKIQDYLDKIRTHDGSYLKKFIDFVPTKESYKVKDMYIRSWMMGVICNFYRNERKCNKFLIFKGESQYGKTTLVKDILLSPFNQLEVVEENFKFSTHDKDDLQKLNTMLFLFDDELNASKKADIENIKKITSQNSITYRKPYGITPKTYYRISSFIGCSNQHQIFNDETGGARWWVLEVNEVIWPHMFKGIYDGESMEKCWGYIYNDYCNGERWNEGKYRIDDTLHKQLVEDSRVISGEEDFLNNIIIPDNDSEMTLTSIVSEINEQYPEAKLNFLNYTNRFGRIMKSIGIKSVRRNSGMLYYCRVKLKGFRRIDDKLFSSLSNGTDMFNLND